MSEPGGDGAGTLAAVAVARGLPFVCVPFGTRNHFARDVGLDRGDPFAALHGFAGEERRVDVGRVGDRLFLNNVSLGVYAALVHRREHHRRRGELLAGLRALWLGLRRRRGVWAQLDGRPVRARIVLAANNPYRLSLFSIGERDSLDEGRLHLYTARGWLPRHWEEQSGERFTLDAPGPLSAAIDGEPTVLDPPVELSIEPRAYASCCRARQAASTSGTFSKASSSVGGSSSASNQRSSLTSSAGAASPAVARAVQ